MRHAIEQDQIDHLMAALAQKREVLLCKLSGKPSFIGVNSADAQDIMKFNQGAILCRFQVTDSPTDIIKKIAAAGFGIIPKPQAEPAAKPGVTITQLRISVLQYLADKQSEYLTATVICAGITKMRGKTMSISHMSKALSDMEKYGLLESQRRGKTGRYRMYRISSLGIDILARGFN